MEHPASPTGGAPSTGEGEVRSLYHAWLQRWNERNAVDMAGLFAEDGSLVGFDGSQVNGRADLEAHLRGIFADHPTSAYVGIVRSVRFLTPQVAVLCAVAGTVPPGGSDINPAVNAVQTLVAAQQQGRWRIAVFQNTPAAFHGRPEFGQQLTEELRQVLRAFSADKPGRSH